jgi:hypothetical protein
MNRKEILITGILFMFFGIIMFLLVRYPLINIQYDLLLISVAFVSFGYGMLIAMFLLNKGE